MKNIITIMALALTSISLLAQTPPMPSLVVIQPPTASDPIRIKLGWDASPSTNIINYRVLWSTNASGPYERDLLVSGTNLTATVTNLYLGQTNYFVVTARDDIGLESLPSNELEAFIPAVRPSAPSELRTAWLFTPEFEVSNDMKNWKIEDGSPTVFATTQKDVRFVRFKRMRKEIITQME